MSEERLMNLCRALSDTVRSGLGLNEAFGILSGSPEYGRFIAAAAKTTAVGGSLHEALKAQNAFPPVLVALVRAGEESGRTAEFLTLYADCLEVRIGFRRRIWRALVYPAFAVAAAVAVSALLSLKAIPFFLEQLRSAGIVLPGGLSGPENPAGNLYAHWPPVLIFICILWLAFSTVSRSGPGRKLWALAGHWLWGFRFASGEARLYHIYTTMGLLLKSGIAPGAMMDILLEFAQDDPVVRRRFLRASAMLSEGKSFSESFGGCASSEDRQSLEIAEKAGRLDETLLRLGKTHQERHLHRLKLLAAGCKLSAIAAIILLSFGMTLLRMRPLLSVFSGVQESLGLPASIAPLGQSSGGFGTAGRAGPAASPAGVWGGLQLPNSYVVGDKTALFNTVNAGKISELMRKPAPKAPISPSRAPRPVEPKTKAKKLVPVRPINKFRFQKIETTPIKATEIK